MMIEDLEREAGDIQNFLEITVSDEPAELIERISMLNVYLARSGKMLADATQLQDDAIASVFVNYAKFLEDKSPTIASKFIQSQISRQNRLVKWIERINRACVHQSDNIRTQISFKKENLRIEKTGY